MYCECRYEVIILYVLPSYSPRFGPLLKQLMLFGFLFFRGAAFTDGVVQATYYMLYTFAFVVIGERMGLVRSGRHVGVGGADLEVAPPNWEWSDL